jgi:hypothetical protein
LQKQSPPFRRAIAAANCLSGVSYRKKCALLRSVIAGHAGCKLGSSCQIGIILMWLSRGKQLMNLSGNIAVFDGGHTNTSQKSTVRLPELATLFVALSAKTSLAPVTRETKAQRRSASFTLSPARSDWLLRPTTREFNEVHVDTTKSAGSQGQPQE